MPKQYPIDDIVELMQQALRIRQIPCDAIDLIIDDYLGAELQGHCTHGLGRFLLIDEARKERQGQPRVVLERGVASLIDGQRELGQIVAALGIQEAVQRARARGIGLCALTNFSRYSRLGAISCQIAKAGLIGVVLNNAGPAAVAPFGGIDPILGTNPISFAFPTDGEPLVFDFATSERVWGEIRQAMLEGRPLQDGAFLDRNGTVTTEPESVWSVAPFGGARGYALGLAIEILAGAWVPAKAGLAVEDQFDSGALLIALQPDLLGGGEAYIEKTRSLTADIRASRPRTAGEPVLVPGDRARHNEAKCRRNGTMAIDETTYVHLTLMAGDAGSGGMAANRLTY